MVSRPGLVNENSLERVTIKTMVTIIGSGEAVSTAKPNNSAPIGIRITGAKPQRDSSPRVMNNCTSSVSTLTAISMRHGPRATAMRRAMTAIEVRALLTGGSPFRSTPHAVTSMTAR